MNLDIHVLFLRWLLMQKKRVASAKNVLSVCSFSEFEKRSLHFQIYCIYIHYMHIHVCVYIKTSIIHVFHLELLCLGLISEESSWLMWLIEAKCAFQQHLSGSGCNLKTAVLVLVKFTVLCNENKAARVSKNDTWYCWSFVSSFGNLHV